MINCPKCGGPLSEKKAHCDRCGEDVALYKKIVRASNAFYNKGLEKAKLRDLSGAVIDLRKSLQLHKQNTNARNLLGLVYFEMGETVAALSEWVISKHFKPEENDADDFMGAVQSNPSKLENMNQAIKKYNLALQSATQGSEDLAIIQLKKVISLNTHFLRAYHLLSLLYMQTNEEERAIKILSKARKIDITNTTTLRYLRELTENSETVVSEGREKGERKVLPRDNSVSYGPISSYKEEKPNVFAFVNLVIGILIGVLVVFFLVVPTVKKQVGKDYTNDMRSFSEQISNSNSKITTLENDKAELQASLDKLQKELDTAKENQKDAAMYDDLFEAANKYLANDKLGAAESLAGVKADKLDREGAKNLYQLIKDNTFETSASKYYEQGRKAYNSGKYEEALEKLNLAFELNPESADTLYFLGRTSQKTGELENAKQYYNKIISDFPDSERVSQAKDKLREIG